eukprot:ANDGO_05790.mRNA.1 RAN GTPase-activating protein 1
MDVVSSELCSIACPVCLDPLNATDKRPIVCANCRSNVCEGCFLSMQTKSITTNVTCPFCRALYPCGPLRTNIGMLDALSRLKSVEEGGMEVRREHLAVSLQRKCTSCADLTWEATLLGQPVLFREHLGSANERTVARLRREAAVLCALGGCPLVLRCYGYCDRGNGSCGLVMQHYATDLQTVLDDPRVVMSGAEMASIARNIAVALQFVHEKGMVHGDLKPSNVCFAEDASSSAGLAHALVDGLGANSNVALLAAHASSFGAFVAPELVSGTPLLVQAPTAASDMFAFGVLLWMMMFRGSELYGDFLHTPPAVIGMRYVQGIFLPFPENASPLFERLFVLDPFARMSASDALCVLDALPPSFWNFAANSLTSNAGNKSSTTATGAAAATAATTTTTTPPPLHHHHHHHGERVGPVSNISHRRVHSMLSSPTSGDPLAPLSGTSTNTRRTVRASSAAASRSDNMSAASVAAASLRVSSSIAADLRVNSQHNVIMSQMEDRLSSITNLQQLRNMYPGQPFTEISSYLPETHITQLDLASNRVGVDGARALSAVLPHTQITQLNLSLSGIGKDGTRALSAVLPRTHITQLNLSWAGIGAEGARALCAVLPQTQITELNLERNEIGPEGTQMLCSVLPQTNIVQLSLWLNKIGCKGVRALSAVLPDTRITELNLESNEIGGAGALALSAVLPATRITKLNLELNKIGSRGTRALCAVLPQTQMVLLNLGSNGIGYDGSRALSSVLPQTLITQINLECNKIGDDGARALSAILRHTQITSLNLGNNGITEDGISFLASVLSQTHITHLNLWQNRIGSEGLRNLSNVLSTTHIDHLNLESNRIGDAGVATLSAVLPQTKLVHLNLESNNIGDVGAFALCTVLAETSVTHLNLESNVIGSEGACKLAELLPRSRITDLNLQSNRIGEIGIQALRACAPQTRLTVLRLRWNYDNASRRTIYLGHKISVLFLVASLCILYIVILFANRDHWFAPSSLVVHDL